MYFPNTFRTFTICTSDKCVRVDEKTAKAKYDDQCFDALIINTGSKNECDKRLNQLKPLNSKNQFVIICDDEAIVILHKNSSSFNLYLPI